MIKKRYIKKKGAPSHTAFLDNALKTGLDINKENFKICHMTDKRL